MFAENKQFPNLIGSTQDSDSFDLYEYLGDSWGVIFMHPADYTPVCTTELGEAGKRQQEFEKRNIKLCGFSCNDGESHQGVSRRHSGDYQKRLNKNMYLPLVVDPSFHVLLTDPYFHFPNIPCQWIEDIKHVCNLQNFDYPLFCDPHRDKAVELGILDATQQNAQGLPLTLRSVFILKPDRTIALMMTYPASTGRNFDEIIRVIDSLQLTANQNLATPVVGNCLST
jgi:peroxiredoxin 6